MATLLFVSASSLSAASGTAKPSHAQDDTAIRVVLQKYENAWNAHDPQAFSQIFTPDAEFTNVRGVESTGPTGIAKAHTPLFAGMFKNCHQQTTRVRIRYLSPNIASVEVRWHMTGALDYLGQPRPPADGIRAIIMIERGGLWRIIEFHNMELPPKLARIPRASAQ
jgi:uncharacterized protein (TIGR02246 family)